MDFLEVWQELEALTHNGLHLKGDQAQGMQIRGLI